MPTYQVFDGEDLLATIEADGIDDAASAQDWPGAGSIEVFLESESPRIPGTFAYAQRYANALRNAAALIEAIPSLAPKSRTLIGEYLYSHTDGASERFQQFAASAREATGKANVGVTRARTAGGDLEIRLEGGGLSDRVRLVCHADAEVFMPNARQAEWPALVEAIIPEES